MKHNVLGMQRVAFRSEYLSPVAKNEMRAKTERKALIAKCLHTRCVCPAWASGIEDTKLFQRVKVPCRRVGEVC